MKTNSELMIGNDKHKAPKIAVFSTDFHAWLNFRLVVVLCVKWQVEEFLVWGNKNSKLSSVLLLRQLCKSQLFRQIYSTVDCKYLLFLQKISFRLKPKQYKIVDIADCLKNNWKLIKQNKLSVQLFDKKPSED